MSEVALEADVVAPLLCGDPGRRNLGAGKVFAALLADGSLAAGGLGKEGERIQLLLDHGLDCQVAVGVSVRIVSDLSTDAPALPGERAVDPELAPGLCRELEVKYAWRVDRHAGAAIAAVFQPQAAAL